MQVKIEARTPFVAPQPKFQEEETKEERKEHRKLKPILVKPVNMNTNKIQEGLKEKMEKIKRDFEEKMKEHVDLRIIEI
jgi:hypothetical protein